VSANSNRIDHAQAGTMRVLGQPDRPTALVCANDCAAVGVVRAAHELGVSIPGQLSVVGFDDADFASLVLPPLTTIRTPTVDIGRQAVRQLMLQIQRPSLRGTRVRLMPELVVRGSTGPVG
jgi:LacI family transcriptional regulator